MDEEEDNGQLLQLDSDQHEQDNEQMQMMVKYFRSKSLPVAYLPQFGILHQQVPPQKDQSHHCHHSTNAPPNTTNNSSRQNQKNSNNKQNGGGGVGGRRGVGTPDGPNHDINNKGKVKDLGGGSSAEQDSAAAAGAETKKRSDWRTLQQHYYPEGGWGYVVTFCALASHALALGIQLYLSNVVFQHFHKSWLGSVSIGISLFLSPLWVSICKRKSTRLAAVFGGLIASLGCLFTSFASQFHQLILSYGAFLGVGVGLTRDASSLMVGQYFKRKRELVEIVVVAGSGIGILLMSISIDKAISSFGWRLGLQAVTGSLFLTFFLGTCYRSASLYHPQRRAILHLKNQKRKVKEKEKRDDKPPFIDFTCLRSKTLQILLLSCAFTAFGINTPLFYLAAECECAEEKSFSLVLLHIYVGVSWIIGCFLFGLIVVQKNQECRVSKQYLCQMASVICGISIVALTAVQAFGGLVIFAWVYGFSLGGYNYALKVYTYERVRARHFPRAWSFIQWSQALPLVIGVPLTGHMNKELGWKSGYYMSALAVFIGTAFLFLTDVRRRRLSRRKTQNSSLKTNETAESVQSPKMRRLSFAFPVEQMSPQSKHDSGDGQGGLDPSMLAKELTCISEEGLADMDFQDIYFEEWAEYFGDCITSCNKVENCLVSEYDPDYAVLVERRARRWSAARPSFAHAAHAGIGATAAALAGGVVGVGTNTTHFLSPHLQPPSTSTHLHLNSGNANIAATSSGNSSSTTTIPNANGETTNSNGGNSSTEPRPPGINSPREIPVFRNHPWNANRSAPPPRSITVIDEASV